MHIFITELSHCKEISIIIVHSLQTLTYSLLNRLSVLECCKNSIFIYICICCKKKALNKICFMLRFPAENAAGKI